MHGESQKAKHPAWSGVEDKVSAFPYTWSLNYGTFRFAVKFPHWLLSNPSNLSVPEVFLILLQAGNSPPKCWILGYLDCMWLIHAVQLSDHISPETADLLYSLQSL